MAQVNDSAARDDGADRGREHAEKVAAFGRELFLGYDLQRAIDRFDLESDGRFAYVDYLSDRCRVDRGTARVDVQGEGGEWTEIADPFSALVVYDMLCHFQDQDGDPRLSGDFCSSGSLTMMAGFFATKELRNYDALAGHADDLAAGCESIGGIVLPTTAHADLTCAIPVFKWFDAIFQFWDGDDEFAPKATFLWDRNSLLFIHMETFSYLTRDIFRKIYPDYEEYPSS